jgi:hypothetical protein
LIVFLNEAEAMLGSSSSKKNETKTDTKTNSSSGGDLAKVNLAVIEKISRHFAENWKQTFENTANAMKGYFVLSSTKLSESALVLSFVLPLLFHYATSVTLLLLSFFSFVFPLSLLCCVVLCREALAADVTRQVLIQLVLYYRRFDVRPPCSLPFSVLSCFTHFFSPSLSPILPLSLLLSSFSVGNRQEGVYE